MSSEDDYKPTYLKTSSSLNLNPEPEPQVLIEFDEHLNSCILYYYILVILSLIRKVDEPET